MLAAALNYGGRHPDLDSRQDALLLGIYSLLRTLTGTLCPDAPLPPEVAPLGKGWILDILDLHRYELDSLEAQRQNRPE